MSKAYDNAKELDYIEFDSSNNKINFTVGISSNSSAIGGSDDYARVHANAAYDSANAAFDAANNVSSDAITNGTSNVRITETNGNVEIAISGTTQSTISTNLISHNEGVLENIMYRVNSPNVTSNITISSSYNYMSIGPITVNEGVTVNVANGARWAII